MQRTKEEAEKLIQKIKTDALSPGIPNATKEDSDSISPHVVIWNLFYGKNYKFSSEHLKEIIKILTNQY